MIFNIEKCKVLHVGARNPRYKYKMLNQELSEVSEEKDVGVLVHKSLKPSLHCLEASKKANQMLGQICRSFHYRDRKVFLDLYKRYVRPTLSMLHLFGALGLKKTSTYWKRYKTRESN